MKKVRLFRLIPIVVVLAALAVILSSCNLLLSKASVRFTNQTDVLLTTVSLGTASVSSLIVGMTSGDYFLDSGTYTLSATNGTTVTWPNGVTVADPKSYTVLIFGTWPNLGAQITEH